MRPLLKHLFHCLSPLRDQDAALKTVEQVSEPSWSQSLRQGFEQHFYSKRSSRPLLEELCCRRVQHFWLDFLESWWLTPDKISQCPEKVQDWILRKLAEWHADWFKQTIDWARLTDEMRHDMRKHIKFLRYGLECLPSSAVEGTPHHEYVTLLKQGQKTMGIFNDLCLTRHVFQSFPQGEYDGNSASIWVEFTNRLENQYQQSSRTCEELFKKIQHWPSALKVDVR